MRILSWNVNGLNQNKQLEVHDTAEDIRSFDVALLTETRCEQSEVFRGFGKFSLPVRELGRAGEGTCVLIHPHLEGSVTVWKLQPEVQAVWVRIKALALGLDRDLFLACVYIPPATSSQLQMHNLSARMAALKSAAVMASELGYVIIGGDFKTKVAAADDTVVSDRRFLEKSGLPIQRGCSCAKANLDGQLLVDFCLSTALLMGTGRLPGDTMAPASFSRGTSDSRLDHLIMDKRMGMGVHLVCGHSA